MTPPPSPRSAAVAHDDRHVVRVRDQGELIAAIPALLGFHPHESLVLMATGGRSGRRLGLTLRVDLPPPEHPAYGEHVELVAASAVRGLLLDDPAGVAVVVLAAGTGGPPGELPHPRLAALVALSLADRDVDVHTLLWAEGTAGGAQWACYDPCGCSGTVAEPAATAFVAATVVEGRVVHADRAELEAVVAPAEAGRIRRREELLIRATGGGGADDGDADDGGETGGHGAGAGSGIVVEAAAGVAALDAALGDAVEGRLALPDTRVVALATALGLPEVRNAALQRSAGSRAAAAEQLWAALARETPDPEAAVPAALLAVSALLRGDGALANVALDRAERAWPGHLLTAVVRRAAEAGMRPAQVRDWLHAGVAPQPAARRGRGSGRRTRRRNRRSS